MSYIGYDIKLTTEIGRQNRVSYGEADNPLIKFGYDTVISDVWDFRSKDIAN